MKRCIVLIMMVVSSTLIFAQDSANSKPFTISGYAEVYYQLDNNHALNNERPGFVYSHNRNNEVALNLGFIKVAYNTINTRANLALAAGSYMNANYSAENGVLKNAYEANVGIKLSNKSNLWLDAGIFPSHIGFESAIGKDCWSLTRSMAADNSPYFETGAKLSYTSNNEKWFLSVLVLNGWQRIQRVNGNTTPAFGTQISFKPTENVTINSSSFIGNDKPDSIQQLRYFHNFYGIFQLNAKWAATLGFDIGVEQTSKGSNKNNNWYTPILMLKYTASQRASLSVRAEYYQDKNGVIIATGTTNGFQTWGFSTNFDYVISKNAVWRIEIKSLSSKDPVFNTKNGINSNTSSSIATSLAINF